MIPQESSREAWQVPWCHSDDQTHLICKLPSPALDMCQRVEQLLVHSQEELVPLEHIVSLRPHPSSMTSLQNLPSAQRLQLFSRDFLPVPSNQHVGMSIWKSWGCPQEAWAPERETWTPGREDSRETQDPGWANQRVSRGEDARGVQASGRQLPANTGLEENARTKVLKWGSQRLVISKTAGEILRPRWENQDQVGVETQELGKKNQREAGGEDLPETQACRGENQEQLRCKTDAETQTPVWENQDRSRNEDAVETQAFEKDRKGARAEDEGETQAQGLRKQGQTESENGEESQVQGWGKQDQIRGDTSTETLAEERRKKDQVGGENAVQSQISWRENLGEVKKEDGMETQALGWEKQECVPSENVTEIQTPGWEKQDQGASEKCGTIQVFRVEIQKQLRHELQETWGNQDLKRGEDDGETQISRRKNLREIREEDWVVIKALWWGDQRPVASEINREFKMPCWGNQDQIRSDHRAEIQALEKRDQKKDRDEDGTNTLVPEAENQRQLRGVSHVETHPPGRRKQEQFGDENSTDIQATGTINLRGVKGEDGKETQELGEESQHQLNSETNEKIHIPKWKNQEYITGKGGANTQAYEVENGGELTSKIDVETHSAEWKKEEQAGYENGAEIQVLEKKNQGEAGVEDGTEMWAPGEENLSQLRGDIDGKTHLSDGKNQEQTGGENKTEIQAPEKRETEGKAVTETQIPERENQGQLDGEIGENHPPERRNWEQNRGKTNVENPTLERKNQREVRNEDNRKIQTLMGGNQILLKSKVNGKTGSSEWKKQEQTGDENGTEIQTQGKRNLRGTMGDDGTESQTPGEDYQGQVRSEIDEEIQIHRQGNKHGNEDAAEIQRVGSQKKCRAEDAGGLRVPRGRNKDQVRGKDAAKGNLQGDYSGGEGPPAFTGSGYRAMNQEQAVASAPCPEIKPLFNQGELFLLNSGEGEDLASQGTAPAGKHKVGIKPSSWQARPKLQRSQQRDKGADPGKASGLTRQLRDPQSLDAPVGLPSPSPSVSHGQALQAAPALVDVPSALTILPKRPVHKKSQQLLLESLMRRKIAHLKWGFPQQILESYLLFNFLGPCPLPLVGLRLSGLHTSCELQGQQEKCCETHGLRPGPMSLERSWSAWFPERKSVKLPTQARTLEKRRPHWSEPMGISTHPEKPKRVRPQGGPKEPQVVQKEAPPKAKLTAPRNPRPTAESRSWCGQERVQEPSSENSRGRKMIRPGVSQMAERAPSRVRISYSRAVYNHWREEHTSWELSRLKCQQPTHRRRGSLEPEGGRGAGQQPSSCSTDTFSFKRSLHSAAARLSMSLLNKISWSPHLAKPQHLAPNLSVQDPDPTLLPKASDPHVREDSLRVHASLKRDLQPPGHCGAGAALPKTEELGKIENPNGAPQNPPAPQKFGFMKHLRCFLPQHGFRK